MKTCKARYTVSKSDWPTVSRIWKNYLWPERISLIEKTSALLFKEGLDMGYKSSEVFFVQIREKGEIIGVCSGQKTGSQEFRSRGLWVSEGFRRRGLGSRLFYSVEKEAQKRGGVHLWTLARHSSLSFYLAVGMKNHGRTCQFEYGPHFWMCKKLI